MMCNVKSLIGFLSFTVPNHWHLPVAHHDDDDDYNENSDDDDDDDDTDNDDYDDGDEISQGNYSMKQVQVQIDLTVLSKSVPFSSWFIGVYEGSKLMKKILM